MIDPDWLKSLSFAVDGGKVVGLLGIGSENIVLEVRMDDGRERALRVPKRTMGFHIREVPPLLSARAEYQLDAVNEKLRTLVGRVDFDTVSLRLDDLYSLILKIISEVGVPGLIFSNTSPDSIDTIPFIIHTPPVRRRLQEFVDWVIDEDDDTTWMPAVNGEKYFIRLIMGRGISPKWPKEAIEGLPRLPERNASLRAATLFDNPLVIWGAAAMEGFFSDDEMSRAAEYIESWFGRIPRRDDAYTLLGQVDSLANLFAQYLDESSVERFVSLCAHCGVMIQARNKAGEVVADGIHMRLQ